LTSHEGASYSGEETVKAYVLRVSGRVQRVGYRKLVLDAAQEFEVSGSVRNVPDGSVEIFVQGEDDSVAKFLDAIRCPPLGQVEGVEEKESSFNPEVQHFRVVYGEIGDELQEGFGAMQSVFTEYWKDFKDYRAEFSDHRKDFRDYRAEFKGFKAEFEDYRKEFRDYAERTDRNFQIILDRYGEISDKLTVILETLVKESRETREILNENIRLLKESVDKLTKA